MKQQELDKLYEEFDIAIKPGQGFKYVLTRDILDRLNKTFTGNWGVHVRHHEMIDEEVLVLVAVTVYNDEGQPLAIQEGFGSAKKFRGVELGNIYKSATSKAIKSAVRNWGVALFLEEDESDNTTSNSATAMPNMPAMPKNVPTNTMPTNMPPNQNAANSMPPNNVPTQNSMPELPSTPEVPKVATVMPGMPPSNIPAKEESEKTNTSSIPPGLAQAPSVSGTMPPGNSAPKNAMPSGALPTMTAVPGQVPENNVKSAEVNNITAVQKVAIASRLGAKGLTFDQVAPEFYSTRGTQAPEEIDGMFYQDALDMVAFLNTK